MSGLTSTPAATSTAWALFYECLWDGRLDGRELPASGAMKCVARFERRSLRAPFDARYDGTDGRARKAWSPALAAPAISESPARPACRLKPGLRTVRAHARQAASAHRIVQLKELIDILRGDLTGS